MRLLVTDWLLPEPLVYLFSCSIAAPESSRAISTARLNPSLGLHLPPIYVTNKKQENKPENKPKNVIKIKKTKMKKKRKKK